MTWENDKNETATQIYSFIADFDEKIYANEERREDSLIQQAAHMQTAFSFVSAALFMVAAIIIDNRGRISLEFLLVAFSSISAVLLSSLFCATQAQKRYKRTSFPNARQLQRLIENQHGNFCSDAQRHKYVVKTYSEIHLAGDTVKVGVNGMVNIAEEYMGFVDEVNDAKLLALASERMAMADSSQFVPAERLYEELGITQDDLDTVGDVDIE